MKTHTTTDSQITPLPALAKRLEAWRASRSVGQRIPEELWQEAVSLAQVHGLSYTSTALKLYYYGRVLAADVRKWDTDGGSGLRLDIFPLSQPVYPQADRADGSARAAG